MTRYNEEMPPTKTQHNIAGFRAHETPESPQSTDFGRALMIVRQVHPKRIKGDAMTKPMSDADKAHRQLLAAIRKIRRNTSGDPMYHSGRKMKEYASPYLEFLDKLQNTARRMPQPYECDLQHAEGTRYADWIEGERILNEVIYECQRSLEEIGHAKLDQEARSWAKGMGLRE